MAATHAGPPVAAEPRPINAGKHVYCEKPIATNLDEAVAVLKLAAAKGIKHGHRAGTSCFFLPGSQEARLPARFRLLSAASPRWRGEFGYWVFRGRLAGSAAAVVELPQRGRRRHHFWTWSATGRYVLDNLFGVGRKRELHRHHGYSRALGTRRARSTGRTLR